MTDSELLLLRLRQTPSEIALLSAFADALMEEGDEKRSALVKELIETESLHHTLIYADREQRISCLRYWLNIRPIKVGDKLAVDVDGSVYPTIIRVAAAIAEAEEKDGNVQCRLVNLYTGRPETIASRIVTSKPK